MKKRFISMLLVASCFGVANAQLVVDTDGKVAIGTEDYSNLHSQFSVNGSGETGVAVHVNTQESTGLKIKRTGVAGPGCGIYVENDPAGFESYGVYGRSCRTSSSSAYASYGVAGIASGSNNGYNFGVAGFLNEIYGAGVFGTSTSALGGFSINGAYAGFFHGDVYTTGSIISSTLLTPSDYRLKKEIKSVSNSCLDNVLGMNVVEYKYKQREFEAVGDTAANKAKRAKWYDEESSVLQNKHYGFIAQELQEIYPDLVVEGEDGYLGVNYIEIIPLLVRSIQELNAKIEQYENGSSPIKKAASRSAETTDLDAVVNTLYQNEPNPFTVSTVIRCDVTDEVAKADLYIYTMNGEQIAEYAVAERGETSVTIDGGSLNAGMYLYALVTDGRVIDTKRMILTK